jgi:hypothetical protein
VSHEAHDTTVPLHDPLGDGGGIVTRPVVNENDFVGSGECRKRRERIGNETFKVVCLVVAREEE